MRSCCSARPGSPVQLTAEYLARHARPGTRWALAGRNIAKLEGVRRAAGRDRPRPVRAAAAAGRRHRCRLDPRGGRVDQGRDHHRRALHPLRRAARGRLRRRRHRLRRPHRRARVRRPDVARLPRAGANAPARGSSTRCGFDSIPYDLGVLYTVNQLPEGVPIHIDCFVRAGGHVLGRHLPLRDPHHGSAAPGCRRGPQRKRSSRDPSGRRVKGASGPPHRDVGRRRMGGAGADDRPADGAALRSRARPLRPRLHLQPLPRVQAPARCWPDSPSARGRRDRARPARRRRASCC